MDRVEADLKRLIAEMTVDDQVDLLTKVLKETRTPEFVRERRCRKKQARYHEDDEYRRRFLADKRHYANSKYHNDTDYRAKILRHQRDRTAVVKAKEEAVLAFCRTFSTDHASTSVPQARDTIAFPDEPYETSLLNKLGFSDRP